MCSGGIVGISGLHSFLLGRRFYYAEMLGVCSLLKYMLHFQLFVMREHMEME